MLFRSRARQLRWRSSHSSQRALHRRRSFAPAQLSTFLPGCRELTDDEPRRLNTLIIRAHEEDWVSNASLAGFYVRELSRAVVGILGYAFALHLRFSPDSFLVVYTEPSGRETAVLASLPPLELPAVHACTRACRPSPYKGYVVPNTDVLSASSQPGTLRPPRAPRCTPCSRRAVLLSTPDRRARKAAG